MLSLCQVSLRYPKQNFTLCMALVNIGRLLMQDVTILPLCARTSHAFAIYFRCLFLWHR